MSYPRRSSFVTAYPAIMVIDLTLITAAVVLGFAGAPPAPTAATVTPPWGGRARVRPGPRPPRPCRLAADARHRQSGEIGVPSKDQAPVLTPVPEAIGIAPEKR